MSKTPNPDRLSKFDRQYLADRGVDPDEYEENFTLDEDGNVVPREEPEGEDALANQADEDDPRLAPIGNPDDVDEVDEDPEGGSNDEDDTPDYSTWDAKALQAEVAERNEGRDEDSKIVPEGTGKEGRLRKGDLVTALQADDANVTEGDDEDDS